MKWIREQFCDAVEIIKDMGIVLIAIIILSDPCKKCLVQACCSDKCEERIILENFVTKGESLAKKKFFAWFMIAYIILVIGSFIYAIFFKT